MNQYVPVHTSTYFQIVKWFSDPPRRSQERWDKGYTSPMHGIQCDEVEFHNCTSLVKYKYILVHTGIYWYVLVHTMKTVWALQRPPLVHEWAGSAPQMCWKRRGWSRGHQGQFCTTGSWAAVRQWDAGGTGRRAGRVHTNSRQREHRQFLLQCCKEMAGQRWWYPAHTTNRQKVNNIVKMSEIYQYIAVHTSMY